MDSGARSAGVSWNSCVGLRSSQFSNDRFTPFEKSFTVSGADSVDSFSEQKTHNGGFRGEGIIIELLQHTIKKVQ